MEMPSPRLPAPKLPFGPDPFRRCRVPDDTDEVTTLGEEDDPADGGMSAEQVERIWESVVRLYRSGIHPAIQLCLRREGAVVLNRSIGHARGNGPEDDPDAEKVLATPATPFIIFSASKAVTAMVAHKLDERGLIHIDDRVCQYIPEYGSHGKDNITINHVLSHRAGVPNLPPEALSLERAGDEDYILEVLCDAKPASRPGKMLAYHAISGGFIVAEITKRVTGKSIREVLAEEVLDPLSFEWGNYGVDPSDVEKVGLSYSTGPPVLPPLSALLKRALGVPVDEVVSSSNDPRFMTATIPAGNVVTTADELSRFFELLRRGGELDGVRIFDERTIQRARVEQSYREIDFSLGAPMRHGAGFILGAKLISLYGPDTDQAFGHLGFTNILGWADPERSLSAALITSGKPTLYPALIDFWNVTRRISGDVPKA